MISLGLNWPILALWYICQGAMGHLVFKQVNGKKFEIVTGVRYENGNEKTHIARSIGNVRSCVSATKNAQISTSSLVSVNYSPVRLPVELMQQDGPMAITLQVNQTCHQAPCKNS